MNTQTIAKYLAITAAASFVALPFITGCASTSHPTTPASMGAPRSSGSMEAVIDQPGPVTVETVAAADWEVSRAGLLNLDSAAAKAAGLKDGSEPINLFVHLIRHPTKGLFLVDTGAEHAFVADADHALVHGFFGSLAHVDKLKVHEDTQAIIAGAGEPVQGVLLTHLHLDHIMGMRDVPALVPVYIGAGDAEDRSFMNLFQKSVYNASLEGKGPLREIRFSPDPDGAFEGILDVFGDGSFWAISVPGHTPGSIAYLARTPGGPVLLTGDTCHTSWGWKHNVEPGTFSEDQAKNADSLARLERLVARHPNIDVRLGHQRLEHAAPESVTLASPDSAGNR
jgi:N-acyl homoserine lactone hydrolase